MYYVEVCFPFDAMHSIDRVMQAAKVAGEKYAGTWACTCRRQGVVWAVPTLALAEKLRQRLCAGDYKYVTITTSWPSHHGSVT